MFKKMIAFIFLLFLISCSSGKIIPTSDICSLKKHYKDNVFQVLINKKTINKHWYIFKDAEDVSRMLAKQNKCMP